MKFSFDLLDAKNRERAKRFFTAYPTAVEVSDASTAEFLGPKSPRRCRFCHGVRPEVEFKDNAHVLPQFMGNKNLRSYFECQRCNSRFGTYESSFARFIGANRALSQIPGRKNRVPTHEDAANKVKLERGEHALHLIFGHDSNSYAIDTEAKELTFKTARYPYIPIHLLKVLVKIGLSLLDENEVAEYELARRFILNDELDGLLAGNPMLHLYGYVLPGPPLLHSPVGQLFYLAPDCPEPLPSKQIILFYGNYCFQLAMPFGFSDSVRLSGKMAQLPRFPLLLNHELLRQFGDYEEISADFTSTAWQPTDSQEITCAFTECIRVDPNESEAEILKRYGRWPPTNAS